MVGRQPTGSILGKDCEQMRAMLYFSIAALLSLLLLIEKGPQRLVHVVNGQTTSSLYLGVEPKYLWYANENSKVSVEDEFKTLPRALFRLFKFRRLCAFDRKPGYCRGYERLEIRKVEVGTLR